MDTSVNKPSSFIPSHRLMGCFWTSLGSWKSDDTTGRSMYDITCSRSFRYIKPMTEQKLSSLVTAYISGDSFLSFHFRGACELKPAHVQKGYFSGLITVEWIFKKLKTSWIAVYLKQSMSPRESPIDALYVPSMVLTNMCACVYQTTHQFISSYHHHLYSNIMGKIWIRYYVRTAPCMRAPVKVKNETSSIGSRSSDYQSSHRGLNLTVFHGP